MSGSLRLYAVLESVLGRQLLYRLGRFFYQGARRELLNDPNFNGEYALQRWVLTAFVRQAGSDSSVDATAKVHVLDVGANLGEWTASFLTALQSNADLKGVEVHAFEPAPRQADAIESRFGTSRDQERVHVCRKAVGSAEGAVSFTVTGPRSGNSAIQTSKTSIQGEVLTVPVTTLDSFSRETGVQQVLLAKVDTEGNDFNVITGAASLFAAKSIAVLQFEYNWRWIEFGHWLKSVFDFTEQLPEYAFGQLTANGIEVHEAWNPEMERYIETNYVIVRRDFLTNLPHSFMQFNSSNVPVLLK